MMWQYALKILVTAAVVVTVSEIAKRSSLWGALLASLPLTSLLAFVWLYVDKGDTEAVAALSLSIFWLVLASLPMFLLFPFLLRGSWGFWPALTVSCVVTAGAYLALVWVLTRLGIQL